MSAIPLSHVLYSGQWRTDFSVVLSNVRARIRICFRKFRRYDSEEAVAETVVFAFRNYGSLARRRKLDSSCPLQ